MLTKTSFSTWIQGSKSEACALKRKLGRPHTLAPADPIAPYSACQGPSRSCRLSRVNPIFLDIAGEVYYGAMLEAGSLCPPIRGRLQEAGSLRCAL